MSLQIGITPKERAAGRFVSRVRRALQKALAEEQAATGVSQSDVARTLGVNRSVISREIRGHKDLTLSRVAEIAWALGRVAVFDVPKPELRHGANVALPAAGAMQNLLVVSSTLAVEPAEKSAGLKLQTTTQARSTPPILAEIR